MKYEVNFRPYTERHFIRTFAKKYKGAWDKTLKSLVVEFTFADVLFEKSIAETICISADNDIRICKTEFKILGTEVSRHASGNRCIIAVQKSTAIVQVLLVYAKGDIRGSNETAGWKTVIKDNYSEYRELLNP
ncbi:MAG: hypothetical protein WCS97_00900 [Candidatus Paceibacterota bacterium]|jgi:hypothetical protein